MAAQIVFNDGGGPVVGSLISPATDVDVAVTASNFDDTGVLGWKWEFLDTPILSSNLRPIPADTFLSTVGFTPDVVGHSILIKLTTYTDVGRTIVDGTDQKVMGLKYPPPFDWLIPAAGETIEVDMLRGWAENVNEQLRETHAFISEHGTIAAGTINLFLRQTGGSDLFDGQLSGTAVQTMPALVALVAQHIKKGAPVVCHLGDGTYPAPVWGTRILDDKLVMIGDGAGVGDGFNRLQTSETADTGTGAAIVKKEFGGLTPDEFRGKTIRLLTGPGSPQRKTIKRNTVDGYIPARDFVPAPDDTTTYEIVESTVELEYTGALTNHFEITGAANVSPTLAFGSGAASVYSLIQLRLTTPDGGPLVTYSNVGVAYYGVEVGGAGASLELALSHCSVFMGTDALGVFAAIPETLGFAANATEWLGWGMAEVSSTSVFFTGFGTDFHMYLVAKGLFAKGIVFTLYGGRLFGNTVAADTLELTQNAIGEVEGTFGSASVVDIEATGGNGAIEVHDLANLQLTSALLSSVTGALIHVREGGQVTFGTSVLGASSGGKAVRADSGEVYSVGAPALTGSPTGTEYDVGDGIAGAAAFFAASGDYLANPNGGVIKRIS